MASLEQKEDWQEFLKAFDLNQDGVVDWADFYQSMSQVLNQPVERRASNRVRNRGGMLIRTHTD